MIRRRVLGVLFVATLSASAALAHRAEAACGDFFKYEADARLSVHAYSRLGGTETSPMTTKRGTPLSFAAFDREGQPIRGDWAAFAIIYAYGGLGAHTAGGVLWARNNLDLYTGGYHLKFAKDGDGIMATLSTPEILRLCKRPMTIRLDGEDRLFLDGVQVGRVYMEPGD